MRLVQSFVCISALLLATASFAEEGVVEEEASSKVEELLNSKLAERIKGYLNQGLLESEQLSKYVDREYWNSVKDDFSTRISTVITEDEFIQAILPIIESVKTELRELIKITLQELVERGERISLRVREAIDKLRQKSAQVVKEGIAKIKELADTKPDEYRALIAKIGDAVGNSASNIAEETTLLAATVLSIATSKQPSIDQVGQ